MSKALLRLLLSFTHKHTHAHTGSHRSQQDARTQLRRKQAAALQPLWPKNSTFAPPPLSGQGCSVTSLLQVWSGMGPGL